MAEIIRKSLRFYGWVQGVGFRWRARHAASRFGATGWVRNESDGSVAMELQGSREQLDQVVQAIQRGSYIRVERVEERQLPVDVDEREFRVK